MCVLKKYRVIRVCVLKKGQTFHVRPLATGEDVGEDLALLAACNHSIISYGTFGMWAAILAGGEVLPRFFFYLVSCIMYQVVTSSTMALTKEGGELKAAKLPNWLVLEQLDPDPGGKNPGSGASILSPLISIFIAAYLLLINDAICPGSDVLRLI